MSRDKSETMHLVMKTIEEKSDKYKAYRTLLTRACFNFARAAVDTRHISTLNTVEDITTRMNDRSITIATRAAKAAANVIVDEGMDMVKELRDELQPHRARIHSLEIHLREIANR
tara:strand:+ start:1656 stop:2000 length:345 start_codon:yes stop_codon:yes gene_type:complete